VLNHIQHKKLPIDYGIMFSFQDYKKCDYVNVFVTSLDERKGKRGQKIDEKKGVTLLSILHGLLTYFLRGCACAPPCSRLWQTKVPPTLSIRKKESLSKKLFSCRIADKHVDVTVITHCRNLTRGENCFSKLIVTSKLNPFHTHISKLSIKLGLVLRLVNKLRYLKIKNVFSR